MSSLNLREIFEAITPENIKDIPLIKSSIDIFIEQIESNSQISIDISKMWDNITNESNRSVSGTKPQNDIIINSKNRLRDLLLQTYVNVIYNTLKKAQSNKPLYDIFKRDGLVNSPLTGEIYDIIGDEYFLSNKAFNEMVGTKKGLRYAYKLGQFIEKRDYDDDLEVEDILPFVYGISGSVYKETFDSIVKPLSHPLGFINEYRQIKYQYITDEYGINDLFNFKSIEIRQINGKFYVFTSDSTDDDVKKVFLTNRINPSTGDLFTLSEYNRFVNVYTDKTVSDFEDYTKEFSYKLIKFTDGTNIIYYDDVRVIYCLDSEFKKDRFNPVTIQSYSEHASLYIDYSTDIEFEYVDIIGMDLDSGLTEEFETLITVLEEFSDERDVQSGKYLYSGNKYIFTTDGFYIYTYDNWV